MQVNTIYEGETKDLLKNDNIVTGTTASLFSLSKNITCTFEYTEDDQKMNGVVYITKNKKGVRWSNQIPPLCEVNIRRNKCSI